MQIDRPTIDEENIFEKDNAYYKGQLDSLEKHGIGYFNLQVVENKLP